jgi:predicted secreted protein
VYDQFQNIPYLNSKISETSVSRRILSRIPAGSGHSMLNPLMIKPLRVLTGLFFLVVLAFGSWQSSYATDDEITAISKQSFRIVLAAAIGSTGYSWSAQFDKAFLKLKKSWYEKPESKLLGASGKQVFMFVPLKPGNTKIEMQLKRPWESSTPKTKVYQISILPK